MVSLKKIRKPDRDEWRGLVVVVKQSEYERIRRAANCHSQMPGEWARDRLMRIAP